MPAYLNDDVGKYMDSIFRRSHNPIIRRSVWTDEHLLDESAEEKNIAQNRADLDRLSRDV